MDLRLDASKTFTDFGQGSVQSEIDVMLDAKVKTRAKARGPMSKYVHKSET